MYASCTPNGFLPARAASSAAGRVARIACLLLPWVPRIALAADGTPFAAPAPVAPFAAPSEGMPLFRVLLALLLVLAAVYAAAKLSRRVGLAGGASAARLEIIAQTSLGPRERAVLLRVGGRDVLLGVATGNVRLLLDLQGTVAVDPAVAPGGPAPGAMPPDGPVRPTFRDLLLKSLGR